MSESAELRLFEAYGIEIEYMIVDAETLSVRPIADELLKAVGGGYDLEVERGDLAWSNELALHVIEFKTNGPSSTLSGLGAKFQRHVQDARELLAAHGATLLPTAMHPWMDPERELCLWPHEHDVIYGTFDRIFNCKGHGWANLQSVHINLPFAGDEEFGKLHAAIRLILPLLPGIAASSPFIEGRAAEHMDARLAAYRGNARRVPSVSGVVVPERVFTQRAYEGELLESIYRDLEPHDPEGVLRNEWVNARGCIARFDRMAIEIRLLDVQECPRADLAVVGAVTSVVRALTEGAWSRVSDLQAWDEHRLAAILDAAIRGGSDAVVKDDRFLGVFGYPERGSARMSDVWQHLIETVTAHDPDYGDWAEPLGVIVKRGCLAARLRRAVGDDVSRASLLAVYRKLADCLARGSLFEA